MIHALTLIALTGLVAQTAGDNTGKLINLPPQQAEVATLHVLIVVDTDDVAGATWGRDGANVKALLESAFARQKLAGRYQIDVFTDKSVTPENILAYYRSLKIGPDDGLFFYYSGHGAYHINKGHFLALTRGRLDRKDLVAAMTALGPRVCVLLTDCCANYAGGAFAGEPKGVEATRTRPALASKPRAAREEPASETRMLRFVVVRPTPRPDTSGMFTRAKLEEPPATTQAIDSSRPRNSPKAKQEEPPATSAGLSKLPKAAGLPVLATGEGKVRMQAILDDSDGVLLRDLCFRNSGLVDINGSTKGAYSYGSLGWGGSLFTNALIAVQTKSTEALDRNKNRIVEWTEVFPDLQRETQSAGRRVPGGVDQTPEAMSLGSPIR